MVCGCRFLPRGLAAAAPKDTVGFSHVRTPATLAVAASARAPAARKAGWLVRNDSTSRRM
jgi:hypothetical protein